jgi:hypothetical protein
MALLFVDEEKRDLLGHDYSDRYFAEALAHIHEDVEHMGRKSTYLPLEKGWVCNEGSCLGNGLDLPKRYFKVHLQYYHNEDVGFTEDQDIMGCSISYSYWYCSLCLFSLRTFVQLVRKWSCPFCDLDCEQNRIKARQKLIPDGMD